MAPKLGVPLIFDARSSSCRFTLRIVFTASFAAVTRSRICDANRHCSARSATVALDCGSFLRSNFSLSAGAEPDVTRTLYVPGGAIGPAVDPCHKIMPWNVDASGYCKFHV